ncbi:MAG: AbrB/MazE/SpoVT family DNA-binding domain-containing protein [Firmicutes bacterium]|nr:AbrB/MazE/SpoVT family DNA-binding domain-containing protein [Bacillota bacterium]
MKETGIVRKIDSLGRIVLPKELRENLAIESGDSVEIYINDDMIVLKKCQSCDIFTGDTEDLVSYKDKLVSKENIKKLARLAGIYSEK